MKIHWIDDAGKIPNSSEINEEDDRYIAIAHLGGVDVQSVDVFFAFLRNTVNFVGEVAKDGPATYFSFLCKRDEGEEGLDSGVTCIMTEDLAHVEDGLIGLINQEKDLVCACLSLEIDLEKLSVDIGVNIGPKKIVAFFVEMGPLKTLLVKELHEDRTFSDDFVHVPHIQEVLRMTLDSMRLTHGKVNVTEIVSEILLEREKLIREEMN